MEAYRAAIVSYYGFLMILCHSTLKYVIVQYSLPYVMARLKAGNFALVAFDINSAQSRGIHLDLLKGVRARGGYQ